MNPNQPDDQMTSDELLPPTKLNHWVCKNRIRAWSEKFLHDLHPDFSRASRLLHTFRAQHIHCTLNSWMVFTGSVLLLFQTLNLKLSSVFPVFLSSHCSLKVPPCFLTVPLIHADHHYRHSAFFFYSFFSVCHVLFESSICRQEQPLHYKHHSRTTTLDQIKLLWPRLNS